MTETKHCRTCRHTRSGHQACVVCDGTFSGWVPMGGQNDPAEDYSPGALEGLTGGDSTYYREWERPMDPATLVGPAPYSPPSALNTQVGGSHYKQFGRFQPWEVFHAWMSPEELKGAMKMAVHKYLAREASKGGREDIRKAAHTLQIYLELTHEE